MVFFFKMFVFIGGGRWGFPSDSCCFLVLAVDSLAWCLCWGFVRVHLCGGASLCGGAWCFVGIGIGFPGSEECIRKIR